MQNISQIFTSVASKVTSSAFFTEILQKQQNRYEIQPYKIENTQGQAMLKTYASILSRRQYAKESTVDQDSWNQNERRVFVWFIICYTYFLQLEKKQITKDTYDQLSRVFFDKNPSFLHFQHLNLLRNKSRVSWTSEEDQLLSSCTSELKAGKWNQISKKIFYNSDCRIFKTPKHCRERWLNHLDTIKKHGEWTPQEDLVIFEYVLSNGKRWSKIVPLLNQTRTEHMIKNRYNSLICKSKSSKKLKEEEIAQNILNQLSESLIDGQRVKTRRQLSHSAEHQQKNQNFPPQNININNSLQLNQGVSYGSALSMGMNHNYFNYNYIFLPQIYLNENMMNFYRVGNTQNQENLQQGNNSFTIYRPNMGFGLEN